MSDESKLLSGEVERFAYQLAQAQGEVDRLSQIQTNMAITQQNTERELAALRAERDRLREALSDITNGVAGVVRAETERHDVEYARLREENEGFRADKERLDWLENNPIHEIGFSEDLLWLKFNGEIFLSLRAAIDAAKQP